jgi:hypothetical protein
MGEAKDDIEILRAQTEAGYVPVSEYVRIMGEAAPPLTAPTVVCQSCGGRGEIGGFDHSESAYRTEPCPDCTAAPTAPDAGMVEPKPVAWRVRGSGGHHSSWVVIRADEVETWRMFNTYEIQPLYSADALTAAAAKIAELEDARLEMMRINNEVRAKWDDAEARAEIYRTVLEAAGYQNIDSITDPENALQLGAMVAQLTMAGQAQLAAAESRAAVLEKALREAHKLLHESASGMTFRDAEAGERYTAAIALMVAALTTEPRP